MKIKVSKFGCIYSAELNLEKQLIVFCGHNSTGKTYLSYLIYYLINKIVSIPIIQDEHHQLIKQEDGSFIITLDPSLLFQYKQSILSSVKSSFDEIFGIPENDANKIFPHFSIDLGNTIEECDAKIKETGFTSKLVFGGGLNYSYSYSLEKKNNSYDLKVIPSEVASNSNGFDLPSRVLLSFIYRHIASYPISMATIFPVERNSIYTFNKELSISRNALIDQMQRLSAKDGFSLYSLLENGSKRYPMAISDGLKVANDLVNLKKHPGEYYSIACKFEQDLLHGTVDVGQEGDVQFLVGNNKRRKHLPIHVSASLIKTMASFFFYLKYNASKNDLVIIDEPEMNMHPDNQILFVSFIAQLMKKGLRFLISTHSDYIIREFNYYIMREKISGDGIDPENVAPYYFDINKSNRVVVQSLPVTMYGFNVPSIDDVIEDQNERNSKLSILLTFPE